MGNLDGKVALVTGAGGMRGVGRATALKLAAQGADLAITDVRRDAGDLPPAEVRQEWHSIDSVSDEIEALGRRCLPDTPTWASAMKYKRWSGRSWSITAGLTS